ncbi:hypothetical protein L486_04097 [Kwoniella mangroviensis CBS 10435]|uniref:Velvet domain-containing protein n=1 Tax=Kwoniella mangroviensis CBS 10435 TaxID=1331196 RepID=A0A1B9IRA6_9TREE|nr:uncharacterized protein I203_02815 [Kwoniella mangroviensis CBS 8507]OCF58068.1 hypothetical protein L486_04097 [Kwoniella mangroviensis CBS 10435]OCF68154.1 hypothetical protein I203_02815 [Kwoniella mangroviensis CBS 8507]
MSRPQSFSPPSRARSTSQSPTTPTHAKKRRRGEKNRTVHQELYPGERRGSTSRLPPIVYRDQEREYDDARWQEEEYEHKELDVSRGISSGVGQEGWTYHLEIIQQPQRARACGFGNKDRRPLSPPPIIRLWIQTALGAIVDPNTIDPRFLILMVDLWSADQQQERNVVMHPVSAGVSKLESPPVGHIDLPPVAGSSSRPSTGTSRPMSGSSAGVSSWSSGSWRQPNYQSPAPPSHASPYPRESPRPHSSRDQPAQSSSNSRSPQSGWTSSRPPPPPPPFHRTQSYGNRQLEHEPDPPRPKTAPSPHHPLQQQKQQPTSTSSPRGPTPSKSSVNLPPLASIAEERPTTSAGLTLPALQAQREQQLFRPGSSSSSLWGRPRTGQSITDASTAPTDYSFAGRPISSSSSSWYGSTDLGGGKDRPSSSWSEMRPWSSGVNHSVTRPSSSAGPGVAPPSPRSSQFAYSSKFPDQQWPPTPGSLTYPQHQPDVSWEIDRMRYNIPSHSSSQPAAQYSRVLVGKVTAICHKLQDEQEKPGLYFFAADLGIRTEGTFTLRMMMTDIASMMDPEVVLGAKAPVLAETFSEPFKVYSAKRFPGVIPTTNLTKVFASQGVKLSVREAKKGSGGGEDAEEEDED